MLPVCASTVSSRDRTVAPLFRKDWGADCPPSARLPFGFGRCQLTRRLARSVLCSSHSSLWMTPLRAWRFSRTFSRSAQGLTQLPGAMCGVSRLEAVAGTGRAPRCGAALGGGRLVPRRCPCSPLVRTVLRRASQPCKREIYGGRQGALRSIQTGICDFSLL